VIYDKDHKSKKKLIIKLRKKRSEGIVKSVAQIHLVFEFNKYLGKAIKIFLENELNWANASLFRKQDVDEVPDF